MCTIATFIELCQREAQWCKWQDEQLAACRAHVYVGVCLWVEKHGYEVAFLDGCRFVRVSEFSPQHTKDQVIVPSVNHIKLASLGQRESQLLLMSVILP